MEKRKTHKKWLIFATAILVILIIGVCADPDIALYFQETGSSGTPLKTADADTADTPADKETTDTSADEETANKHSEPDAITYSEYSRDSVSQVIENDKTWQRQQGRLLLLCEKGGNHSP